MGRGDEKAADAAATAAMQEALNSLAMEGVIVNGQADDDGTVHRKLVERGAHRFDRGRVGRLLVAAADQAGRGDGRGLGHPDHFEDEQAVKDAGGGGASHDAAR
jgi:hypothetical protein